MSKTQRITESHLAATLLEVVNQLQLWQGEARAMKERALEHEAGETEEHREQRLRLHAFKQGNEWAYADVAEMVQARYEALKGRGK